ncbi:hypothetical protein MUN46_010785 [Mesosutterella sp. AGMB02718]|uniref:Uncharacterized protein n=1 Tax=Mesosutterella faecium TaxID=2925194 RepID=A0ABT7IR89_9BURK|nr:hypothetical protein [Mesosutterella sp. AGMB02718]MDL2060421.1 hypothetical protein [Mesosutterella sp. AGMB02718]
MKKLLVLLMCFAAAVPTITANKSGFDKNGVSVSPEGWVFTKGPSGVFKDQPPIEKETPPSFIDMRKVGNQGTDEIWEDTRNGRLYTCNKETGCR